jgi:hypothetical protein
MTDEEMEHEADKSWRNRGLWYVCNANEHSYKDGFKDAAKPREKRIADLEKENAELKEKVSYLEDNLRVARKDRENLQLDVAKGLKEFVKDYPATSLRFLANEKYIEQLTQAKEIIRELLNSCFGYNSKTVNYEVKVKAEQFLKEV